MRCACDLFTLYTFSFRFDFFSFTPSSSRCSVWAHTHSSLRAHISWPLEMRYLPGSSERIWCLRMRERAACLYYLTTAYSGEDVRRNNKMRSPRSVFCELSASERMPVAPDVTWTMEQKEKNDELNSTRRKTNEEMLFFFESYVKLCVWFVGQYLTRVQRMPLLQCRSSRCTQKRRTKRRRKMLENAFSEFGLVCARRFDAIRSYPFCIFHFSPFGILCSH